MTEANSVLAEWTFNCSEPARTSVLPDGCRDLILLRPCGDKIVCFVTGLAERAYAVESAAGAAFRGFRFQPGAVCDERALLLAVNLDEELSAAYIRGAIAEYVRVDEAMAQALASIAQSSSIAAAARGAGLSERTLARMVLRGTGKTPGYWKALARVRRAGQYLAQNAYANAALFASATAKSTHTDICLLELAIDHGFSDQSHMTHAFRRWFGVTPAQFRADRSLLRSVTDAGYA
jgi:AraC-like DNA-binding protein